MELAMVEKKAKLATALSITLLILAAMGVIAVGYVLLFG
jgi:hypothetical protein